MKKHTTSGEQVVLTGKKRDLGTNAGGLENSGVQYYVIYSDGSMGWEHEEDLHD